MQTINLLPVNATGTLSPLLPSITKAFEQSTEVAIKELGLKEIDVLVFDFPQDTIKELGIGGRTFNKNLIYININPDFGKIEYQEILATMYHEYHHAARFASVGYGATLLESLFSEGLACLYEKEKTGRTPIYVKSKVTEQTIELISKDINSVSYNHTEIFVSGNNNIPKWFGYSYGYNLAKKASINLGKSASQLVSYTAKDLYNAAKMHNKPNNKF
jgi:uncharacterized protein YjaZ